MTGGAVLGCGDPVVYHPRTGADEVLTLAARRRLVGAMSFAFALASCLPATPAHAEAVPRPYSIATAATDAGVLSGTAATNDGASSDTDAIAEAADDYEAGDAGSVAGLAQAASATEAVPMAKSRSGLQADGDNGTTVTVAKNGSVSLGAPGIPKIGLSVAGDADATKLVDGVLVQTGVAPSTDVVIRATDDGVQFVAVMGDEDAPNSVSFPIDLPKGAAIAPQADGSFTVTAPVAVRSPKPGEVDRFASEVEAILGPGNGASVEPSPEQIAQIAALRPIAITSSVQDVVVATVARPWAVDADGNGVETSYALEGDTLRQVVYPDDTTVYPITVDPRIRHAWYGVSVDFTKAETKIVSRAGNDCAAILALGTAVAAASEVGAPVAVVLGIIAAGCGVYGRVADNAVDDGKCLSFKWVWGVGVPIAWESKCYK